MQSIYDTYTLNNGVEIPVVGYGTFKVDTGNDTQVLSDAIRAGWRFFDTAAYYGNEQNVGEALAQSGLPRQDFFLSTKVWPGDLGYEKTLAAFELSLKKLQTDYLDLYLIHWPVPVKGSDSWKELDVGSWKAMEELYKAGRVRAIGLSNCLPHHILNILDHAEIVPAVDQLEIHPGYDQEVTVRFCQERGIRLQAWSPLGRGSVLTCDTVVSMAAKYGVSPAQLCLRFSIQRGIIPLVKASSFERMKQNQDLFGFEISQADMYRLLTMIQTGFRGLHPDDAPPALG